MTLDNGRLTIDDRWSIVNGQSSIVNCAVHHADRNSWLLFRDPREVLVAMHHADVLPLLRKVEDEVEVKGRSAAGFIAYEAAPAFDNSLVVHPHGEFPLAWFAISDAVDEIPESQLQEGQFSESPVQWTPTVSDDEYRAAISRVRSYIKAGETYQVNYSYRLRSGFSGDPCGFFTRLHAAQRTGFAAFIDTGRFVICSTSPELFFSLKGKTLTSRPMKGTAPRGLTAEDDIARGEQLRRSPKDRAENVMIVDMMRNDVGKVARTGTVQVTDLFSLEKYSTLWQLTSTVQGVTDAGLTDIMTALFPAASITGAPKPRTMQIIRELESTPRGIYTGTVGYVLPGRNATFSVSIRTVLIDREQGSMEYGVGGGIVWGSTDEGELAESRTKALVVTEPVPEFSLLETMLWKPGGGFFLLDLHLERLKQSAAYFAIPVDLREVQSRLADCASRFNHELQKVRLLISQSGEITLQSEPLGSPPPAEMPRVRLACKPVCTSDRFLYHKTTMRKAYEEARAGVGDCDDVILWNERGELTESTIANLVLEIDGGLVTPPVHRGLLSGVYRRWMLEQKLVKEQILTRVDLHRATRVFLINSVRGQYEVSFVGGSAD
ncbi:MAG: bifunctional anthranilate synthase component I family protein/class IV aminotransferase [Bacteroidota bacterium]